MQDSLSVYFFPPTPDHLEPSQCPVACRSQEQSCTGLRHVETEKQERRKAQTDEGSPWQREESDPELEGLGHFTGPGTLGLHRNSHLQHSGLCWPLLFCINPVFSGFSEIPGCSEAGTEAFVAVPSHSAPDLAQNGQSLGTVA